MTERKLLPNGIRLYDNMTADIRPLRRELDFILYFYIIINKNMCRHFTLTDRHVKKKATVPSFSSKYE